MLALAGSLRSPSASRMRGMPTRLPYSDQLKLGMSGMCERPCGGTTIVRGIGWSNCQYSMFTTTCTMSGLPRGAFSFARALCISYGMRGFERFFSATQGLSQRGGERRVVLRTQGLRIDDQDSLRGEALGEMDRRVAGLQLAAHGSRIFFLPGGLWNTACFAGLGNPHFYFLKLFKNSFKTLSPIFICRLFVPPSQTLPKPP